MFHVHRRSLLAIVVGILFLVLAPAVPAQEDAPTESSTTIVEEGAPTVIPEPAVRVGPEAPAAAEQAWTFRYLIPTSLVIALLVVVGSIVAYFLRVVRTRYRLIQ